MSNLVEVSSLLWLVVATFVLPLIKGNFSLFLSKLQNTLRRKKQKSAHETETSLLLATPLETARSVEPTIMDTYVADSYYYIKS